MDTFWNAINPRFKQVSSRIHGSTRKVSPVKSFSKTRSSRINPRTRTMFRKAVKLAEERLARDERLKKDEKEREDILNRSFQKKLDNDPVFRREYERKLQQEKDAIIRARVSQRKKGLSPIPE